MKNNSLDLLIEDVLSNEELNSLYQRYNWTPSMTEWKNIKESFSNEFGKKTIILFQMGKFYETYFHDAYIFSKLLNVSLTKKNKSDPDSSPMSGVNIDFAQEKINKLAQLGLYVIIVSESEDRNENGQFIRGVERILTPGTYIDNNDKYSTNIICSVNINNEIVEFHFLDVNSLILTNVIVNINDEELILSILSEYQPKEIILSNNDYINLILEWQRKMPKYENNTYSEPILWNNTNDNIPLILSYAKRIFKNQDILNYINVKRKDYVNNNINYITLDSTTIENLELLKTSNGDNYYSIKNFLDNTITPLGQRLFKSVLLHPLKDIVEIKERQNTILNINKSNIKDQITHYLLSIYDLERLTSKIANSTIIPSDFLLLSKSLKEITNIKYLILETELYKDNLIKKYIDDIISYSDIIDLIETSFLENPNNNIKEGNIFKYGYNKELDNVLDLIYNKEKIFEELKEEYTKELGLNINIIENTQGIFIEVNSKQLINSGKKIPVNWYMVRGTKVYERFSTDKLIDLHKDSLISNVKRNNLEYKLFSNLRIFISSYIEELKNTANSIAWIDLFFGLEKLLGKQGWSIPEINNTNNIIIMSAAHPVIEDINDNYIRNNIILSDKSFKLLTGPNMGGKSIYLKSIGLITLLTQIGSPIPAKHAEIGLVDNIFVRAGANDNFVKGQSTFYLEMYELSNIINKASKKSLVLLDEIGRGTDTKDGESIALATCEYFIENNIRTIFATHYHSLIEKISNFNNAGNIYVEVIKDSNDNEKFVFTHKIIEGNPITKNSYGIEIAKMAGLNKNIISRAFELKNLL